MKQLDQQLSRKNPSFHAARMRTISTSKKACPCPQQLQQLDGQTANQLTGLIHIRTDNSSWQCPWPCKHFAQAAAAALAAACAAMAAPSQQDQQDTLPIECPISACLLLLLLLLPLSE